MGVEDILNTDFSQYTKCNDGFEPTYKTRVEGRLVQVFLMDGESRLGQCRIVAGMSDDRFYAVEVGGLQNHHIKPTQESSIDLEFIYRGVPVEAELVDFTVTDYANSADLTQRVKLEGNRVVIPARALPIERDYLIKITKAYNGLEATREIVVSTKTNQDLL